MLALLGFVGLAALVPLSRAGFGAAGPMALAGAVLCPITGVGAWLVWRRIDVGLERKRAALRRWGWLMLLAGLAPAAPSGPGHALLLVGCLFAAIWTTVCFRRLRPAASLLLLPFSAWLLLDALLVTTRF